jgi:hypothetical protein
VLASGGTELLDDVADVLSFAMNSIFSRDHDLVHRLVPASTDTSGRPPRGRAADQLRDTLQPNRHASEATIEDAREFMRKLIALRRLEYETAMRAIRRVIGAWRKIDERPTAAYTDLVAALESLADKAQNVPAPTWENVDSRKRKVLDPVLAVGLLNERAPAWTAQQYLDLAKARREERGRKKSHPLPQGVDAALLSSRPRNALPRACRRKQLSWRHGRSRSFPGTLHCRRGRGRCRLPASTRWST